MRYQGVLKVWNVDRGFGFIRPDDGGKDLFIHISSFPKDGVSPQIGETIRYEITTNKDGKPQASFIERLDIQTMAKPYKRTRHIKKTDSPTASLLGNLLSAVFLVVVLSTVGYFLYGQYHRFQLGQQEPIALSQADNRLPDQPEPQATADKPIFTCDGRTYCSQMHSYEEAVFFINHCPGTKMDGNHDGIPCQEQFGK